MADVAECYTMEPCEHGKLREHSAPSLDSYLSTYPCSGATPRVDTRLQNILDVWNVEAVYPHSGDTPYRAKEKIRLFWPELASLLDALTEGGDDGE